MEQALAGARTIGDASIVTIALQILGGYLLEMGDTARALALMDESLVEARHLDDDVDAMLNTLVVAADRLLLVPSEEGRAVALAEETVELAQRVGKPYYEVRAHSILAYSALLHSDPVQAEEQALRALRLARDQGLTDEVLSSVESVGLIGGQAGHAVKSARLLGAVASLREAAGIVEFPNWQAAVETLVALARAELGEEPWAVAFAAGRVLTLAEVVAEALEESPPD